MLNSALCSVSSKSLMLAGHSGYEGRARKDAYRFLVGGVRFRRPVTEVKSKSNAVLANGWETKEIAITVDRKETPWYVSRIFQPDDCIIVRLAGSLYYYERDADI